MATKWYTQMQLARALVVSHQAVRQMLDRGAIRNQTVDADGRELFSERYVERIVSERRGTKE